MKYEISSQDTMGLYHDFRWAWNSQLFGRHKGRKSASDLDNDEVRGAGDVDADHTVLADAAAPRSCLMNSRIAAMWPGERRSDQAS